MELSEGTKRRRKLATMTTSADLASSQQQHQCCDPLPNPKKPLLVGPLFFNPSPETLTLLFSSPSLSYPLTPQSHLSLAHFLQISHSSSTLTPSVVSPITSVLGPYSSSSSTLPRNNRLQLLPCPDDSALAFFPTGSNSDQLGYLILSVKGSKLEACGNNDAQDVFMEPKKLNHPIISIWVSPVACDSSSLRRCFGGNFDSFGYLMACTMYSVHWFSVGFKRFGLHSHSRRPGLKYLGAKVFNSAVVHACWSPHIPEESVVLLESGELVLFDLDSYWKPDLQCAKMSGRKLRVPWDNLSLPSNFNWLSFDFSFHPEVLIVACSNAVFQVDLRSDQCRITYVVKIDLLARASLVKQEQFVAFSRAGPDGFCFALASKHWLYLFDTRQPLRPVLRWAHNLNSPCYIEVLKLSDLRSHARDDLYKWASESGFAIIMGSFWTCEFSLFFYGPDSFKTSKCHKSLCSWGLPLDPDLSGSGVHCGSFLLREELSKDALPIWIDWQQEKELVLGFSFLSKDLFAVESETERDTFGGFMLIRLVSSGKLESQRYCASWVPVRKAEEAEEKSLQFEDPLLCSLDSEEYKFTKRYKYFQLNYLDAYLSGKLTKVLVSKLERHSKCPGKIKSFHADFHKFLCEKLMACGVLSGSSNVFREISLPLSIYEVTSWKLWAGLPMPLLLLAFSSYSECGQVLLDKKSVPLEFSAVPEQPQLPPFLLNKPSCRSNKWSHKVQQSRGLVGPVLPLPILLTLCESHKKRSSNLARGVDNFSPEVKIKHQCDETIVEAKGMLRSSLDPEHNIDHAVSLADDGEEAWAGSQRPDSFFLYDQSASLEKSSPDESIDGCSIYQDERYATLVFKRSKKLHVPNSGMQAEELFDDLCPVALKFDSHGREPSPGALKSYKILRRQHSRWQDGFRLYQQFCTSIESGIQN